MQEDNWTARVCRLLSWAGLIVGYFFPTIPMGLIYLLISPSYIPYIHGLRDLLRQFLPVFFPLIFYLYPVIFLSLAIALLAVLFFLRRFIWFFVIGFSLCFVYSIYIWADLSLSLFRAGSGGLGDAFLVYYIYPAGIIGSLELLGLSIWRLRMEAHSIWKLRMGEEVTCDTGFATFLRRGLWLLFIPYLLLFVFIKFAYYP